MWCLPHQWGEIKRTNLDYSLQYVQALVVAGGNNGSANLASMLTLLPGASVWTALAPLPRSLYGAGALFVGGRLRLTGGRDDGGSYRSEVSNFRTHTFNLDNVQNSSTKVLEYYPVPWNTWVKIGNLLSGRALHAVLPIGPQHIACVAGEVRLLKIKSFLLFPFSL